MAEKAKIDPVLLEVVRNALMAVSEQMAVTVRKTSFSTIVREQLDFSTALFDARGRIVAPSAMIPFQMNSMSPALEQIILRYYPLESWAPGDVIIVNDPYLAAGHLPDVMAFSAVHYEGKLIGMVGSLVHHIDIGGRSPGSYGGDVTEIYQEGLRIPPVKLYEAARVNRYILDIIQYNVREPEKVTGDLHAQVAALEIGTRGMQELARKYGPETLEGCMAELLAYSERRMRAKIRELPNGTFSYEDFMDGDGIDDKPIKIKVAVTIEEDTMTFDFSGCDPQVKGPINSTLPTTMSTVYYVAIAVVDPSIPQNYGCYRPIRIIAPLGTVANAQPPAPVVGRVAICHRMVDAMLGALSQVIPEKVMAAYYGMSNIFTMGGMDPDTHRQWVLFEVLVGGWGGRPTMDGLDVYSAHLHNVANTPIEMLEMSYPVLMERYELIQDSGGAGKFRGGLGVRRDYRLLAEEATITLQGERHRFLPYGLFGGAPGRRAHWIVAPGASEEIELPSKTTNFRLKGGQVVRAETQGGGGFGDPRERDREAVVRDLREGKISQESARQDYGLE